MAKFPLLTDLSQADQAEYARVNALPATARTAKDTNFLNARASYSGNEVVAIDSAGLIISAAGNGVPGSWTGFKKGAIYVNKQDTIHGTYLNTGDQTGSTWQKVTSV